MLNPLTYYRVARWLYVRGVPILPRIIDRLSVLVFHCYLPHTISIGKGFELGYWGIGVVVHPQVRMGRNVFIAQGVTVGGRSQCPGVPRIEDNVYIGAGAKVLGDVVVGEGSVVGANAVVIHSVPPRTIVAGVPARIVRRNIDVYDYTGWPKKELSWKGQPGHPPAKTSDVGVSRVFQFVDSLNLGGTETQVVQTVRRLASDQYQVTVGCLHANGPLIEVLQQSRIPICEFPPRSGLLSPSGIFQILRLARFLRKERFDVVHTHDLYSNLMGVPAAWLARVPVIISSRRDLANWWWYTPRNRKLLRLVQSLSTAVVANSEAVRNYLIQKDGFRASSIKVIRNGVDIERFSNIPRNRQHLYPGFGSDEQLVAVVANMNVKGKGHMDLVEAACAVCRGISMTRFLLIGDGVERRALEAKVQNLGLSDSVLFLGHQSDIPELLACCDLSVLPSWSEGLPNVVLESMAAGLPVVATSVGGTIEIIEHEMNGLLVPPHNPSALAEAVMRILQDKDLANRLARSGREWVEAHHGYARVLNELKLLYEEARPRAKESRFSSSVYKVKTLHKPRLSATKPRAPFAQSSDKRLFEKG
jgi:glycosyltransferase involved in cell wall biosynthesis/serine acetyltransferase